MYARHYLQKASLNFLQIVQNKFNNDLLEPKQITVTQNMIDLSNFWKRPKMEILILSRVSHCLPTHRKLNPGEMIEV